MFPLMIIYAWIGYYNFARMHMTLSGPPNPLSGKTELEKLSKEPAQNVSEPIYL